MRDLPSFQTSLVPVGTFVAEVAGEITEKTSNFDNTRTYLELPFTLTSPKGEIFPFTWWFTPRSQKLAEFLIAIGGRRLPSGNILPPKGPYIGRRVTVQMGQRTAKGSKDQHLVNEVLAVYPYDEAAEAEAAAIGGDDEGDPIPF